MTAIQWILVAAAGSASLLAGAYVFQALGYAPCQMCLWQRWPHMAAIALGLLAFAWRPSKPLAALGAIAAATTGALGVYHAGVEVKLWPGPSSCGAGALGDISTQDLLTQILQAPLVRCDEVAWSLMGISMAGWNALASFALAGIWLIAMRKA
jgi:disulfide bond formation protein DsbB